MNILIISGTILIVSLLLAIKDASAELSIPESVKKIKIKKKKKLSGVIIFLRKKIIHYSSDSS